MSQIGVAERVERVAAACASATRERAALTLALSDLARIESWAAARRAQLVAALAERPGSFPEADIADTTGCSLNAATKETDRAATLGEAAAFADALDAGDIRPGHVDALTRARKRLTEEQAATLLDAQDELADVAAGTSIGEFDQVLRRRIAALQTEADREATLERQRRNTRLSTWVDQADGMWRMSGSFDPQTGSALHRAIEAARRSLFADGTPSTAPLDPRDRREHLTALAVANLVLTDTAGSSRPGPPIVVVDTTVETTGALDDSPAPGDAAGASSTTWADAVIDWGLPIELPMSVLHDVFDVHDPDVVIVADGVVLHAPGRLDLGRTTRLANRAQRRALAGLYATCAVPGCAVHYDQCKLHHVIWWRHGGRTDFANLLPVCQHHHTRLHDEGWEVTLGVDRSLRIVCADGRVLTSGPPRRSAA